jgi:hypothetical protein
MGLHQWQHNIAFPLFSDDQSQQAQFRVFVLFSLLRSITKFSKSHDGNMTSGIISWQPEVTRYHIRWNKFWLHYCKAKPGLKKFSKSHDSGYNTVATTTKKPWHNIVSSFSDDQSQQAQFTRVLEPRSNLLWYITKFSLQMVYHQVQLSNCRMGTLLGSARKNMTSISKPTSCSV